VQPSSVDGQTAVRFVASPPLHDRVELHQRHPWIAEQAPQDRGAGGERQVRDDRERLGRQRQRRRVALDDLHAGIGGEVCLEPAQRAGVELHRPYLGARVRERARQRAATGTEVEHQRSRHDTRIADQLVCEDAPTKSVAPARALRRRRDAPCHGRKPSWTSASV
jgi:hypothetical protein